MNTQPRLAKDSRGGGRLSAPQLIREAERQSQALKMIGRWRTAGFILSAVGALLLYMGISGAGRNLLLTAAGLVLAAGGLTAAILCDLGIRNGRRNVEKILQAAQAASSTKTAADNQGVYR